MTTRNLPLDLIGAIRQLQADVKALQTQQSFHITDANLKTVIAAGAATNPINGELLDAPQPTYGITVFDPTSGLRKAQFGQLPDGTYGIAIWESADTYVELSTLALGVTSVSAPGSMDMSGSPNVWQDDTDGEGPVATGVIIGTSGRALVRIESDMTIDSGDGAGQVAAVGLSIDGDGGPPVNFTLPAGLGVTGTTTSIAASVGKTNIITGLSPGPHNFRLLYFYLEDFTVNFKYRTITVQPF